VRTVLSLFVLTAVLSISTSVVAEVPTTNAQYILDVLEKGAADLVKDVKVGAKHRVAVINLESAMDATKTPSVALYDMMVMALSEKGITIVERDRVGLAAAAIEGWTEQLPVFVSATCTENCPGDEAVAAAPAPAPAAEEGTGGLLGGLAKALPALPAIGGAAAGGAKKSATASYDGLLTLQMEDWLTSEGQNIVGSVLSATHVLGYRPLFVGVTLQPSPKKGIMVRHARVDLMLRLINSKFGTVQWTKRVSIEASEEIAAVAVPLLGMDRFSYSGDQFGESEGETPSLGGLLGK
jgi:hypothetical protein